MDKDRQIRFLYPPLIFIGSIALGICFDKSTPLKDEIIKFISSDNSVNLLIALLGAGSLILLLGFLISTITVCILKILCFNNGFSYEQWLSEKSYSEIGERILKERAPKTIPKKDRLYAVASFDHGFISQRVHQWIVRRWNAFFISSASAVA